MMKADLLWLENPEVFQVGRMKAHSDHKFYEKEEDWQQGKETLRQSLNGTWKFHWSPDEDKRPKNFYEENYDLCEFGEIQVPGHMELQGYGQIQYINTMYPWDGYSFLRPPYIDRKHNPVGSYVKEFDLEEGLLGKRVCISFQGVEQAFYLWVNGHFIGYSEDSFTPSEFDITEVVKDRNNRICVEVYKRSSAAWIEDQDFFRFSGIFRDVFLYAKPEIHMDDLWIKAGLLEDYTTGTLEAEVKISGKGCSRIEWKLMDEQKCLTAKGQFKKQSTENGREMWIIPRFIFPNVHKWDVEKSYLYQFVAYLYDSQSNLREVVPYRIGFRRFELKDKIMLLNGKRLEIHGVNRHEWNAERGRAIQEEDMRADMEIMKRNHINAVRTCHYPDQSLWYQLCDEEGICVMDETNMESHGSWEKMGQCDPSWNVPGSCEEWKACVLDRAQSMFERDKNHPSVLWWSCGNESYAGTDILAMSKYFHKKDPSRLVHYEGVSRNREFEEISDVESRMYATPQSIREYLEKDPQKPFILCEYMHDMGNSLGGMESYMKLFEEYPMYQGGFIWDFIDQALWYTDKNGKKVLGYGGDFGDRPTDYAFSCDGILFADRSEKPAMQEIRFWYTKREERQRQQEENRRLLEAASLRISDEYRKKSECALLRESKLKVIHGDVMLGVQGDNFEIIFSFQDGGPISMKLHGKECLFRAPRPAFWRASTENDVGNGFASRSSVWFAADRFSVCTGCEVIEYEGDKAVSLDVLDMRSRKPASENIDKVKITYTFRTDAVPSVEARICYIAEATGYIRVKVHYEGAEGAPQLPVFGIRFCMPEYEKAVTWEGLSGETYPDRMCGGIFGTHSSRIGISDYMVPQECGNHMDTCRMKVGNMELVMDEKPFIFSALPYTPAELENATHKEELPAPCRTIITVAARMRGVGGIDSWGADVEEPYHISGEENLDVSFMIKAVEEN